jgi:hypothetical protein
MRGKQLAVVLLLLAALGGIALLLHNRNTASWSKTATTTEGKVLSFSLNDVSRVTIKSNGAEVNLLKKDDVWKVKERFDYPADFDKVATLIRKLWELRPAQDVKIGPSQLARLQLNEPANEPNSGVLVDLKGNEERRLAALLLGKKHLRESDQSFAPGGGIPAGRYVTPQDGSNRVFLISETLDEVQAKPEQWLNREFIKVEKPKLIAVAGPSPGMNWKLIRENDSAPWKFADPKRGEELDAAKVSGVAAPLANATFTDVLDPKTPSAQSGFDKPSTARIETFDNFVYELRIGKLMGENYPVLISVTAALPKERTPAKDEKPEDKAKLDQQFQATQKPLAEKLDKEKKLEDWSYLISKSTIEQLIKDRTTLLVEKKSVASPTPAPPSAATPKRKPK